MTIFTIARSSNKKTGDIPQVAIMGDFFYFYIRSLQKGTPLQLPSAQGLV